MNVLSIFLYEIKGFLTVECMIMKVKLNEILLKLSKIYTSNEFYTQI